MKFIRIFSGLLIVSAIILTACSHPDTTKVTIYFTKNGQASLEQKQLPLIDRFLNLFNSKAYAQIHIPSDTEFYFLYVTADDIDTIFISNISGTQTSVSIDVSSGGNRVFTIFSFSPNGNYNYVGQTVANLTGGDAAISVIMYPCLNNIIVTGVPGNNISIDWTSDSTLSGFSTVTIYRACIGDDPSCNGAVTTVTTVQPITTHPYSDGVDLAASLSPQAYYYFLSINTGSFGGGGLPHPANFEDFFTNNSFIAVYMMGFGTYNNIP